MGYDYLLKKIGWALFTIVFVIVLNFFLFRVLPGDPARAGIRDPRLTVEAIEAIRVRFGLDKPVINCFETLNPLRLGRCNVNPLQTQFLIYVDNLLRGELGISYQISPKRTRDAASPVKKYGGRVEAMYALLGEKDLVFILNFPGVGQAMKASVALSKMTGIGFSTYPAVSVEEFDRLMARK